MCAFGFLCVNLNVLNVRCVCVCILLYSQRLCACSNVFLVVYVLFLLRDFALFVCMCVVFRSCEYIRALLLLCVCVCVCFVRTYYLHSNIHSFVCLLSVPTVSSMNQHV